MLEKISLEILKNFNRNLVLVIFSDEQSSFIHLIRSLLIVSHGKNHLKWMKLILNDNIREKLSCINIPLIMFSFRLT